MQYVAINRVIILFTLTLLSLFSGYAHAGQVNMNGWEIATDAQGTITSMTFRNPPTTLQIEAMFTFTLMDGYEPQNGSISFRNGFKREMTSGGRQGGEMKCYWDLCKGFHTVWEYYRSINRVSTQTNSDLQNYIGRFCRVEIANGNELFGIVSTNGSQDGIIVTIEDACCGPIPVPSKDCRSIQRLNQ